MTFIGQENMPLLHISRSLCKHPCGAKGLNFGLESSPISIHWLCMREEKALMTMPKGAVWSGFIVFASLIKSSLKYIWIYVGDKKSRWFFRTKNMDVGAQWLSGRVLDSRPRGCWLEPYRHHCFVSLSKTHLSKLSNGSTQEDLSLYNWKIVDWDVKNQSKQTKNYSGIWVNL